jgi:GAF domain-containing protein
MTVAGGSSFDAILAVGEALVSDLEYDTIFATVAKRIGEAMHAWSIDLQTLDSHRQELLYVAYWCVEGISDRDRSFLGSTVRLADWPTWRRVADAAEMLERHIDDPDLPADERGAMVRWGYRTTLDCPLVYAGEVVGVLGLREARFVRRFTDVERDLLSQLCDLAAIAIRNAGIYRREQEEQRRLNALAQMSGALVSSDDLTEVCRTIARAAASAFEAPRAIIYEYDAEADTITARGFFERDPYPGYDSTGIPEPLDESPRDREVLKGRRPVAWRVDDADLEESLREHLASWGEATVLNVPLIFRDRPLGILIVVWTQEQRHFSPAEIDFAAGVGEHAAIALQHARLSRQRLPGPHETPA